MFRYVGLWLGLLTRCFQSHPSLLRENLALRQQLAVLKRKHPRPRIGAVDKIFWVFARRFWSTWKHARRECQSHNVILALPSPEDQGRNKTLRECWFYAATVFAFGQNSMTG